MVPSATLAHPARVGPRCAHWCFCRATLQPDRARFVLRSAFARIGDDHGNDDRRTCCNLHDSLVRAADPQVLENGSGGRSIPPHVPAARRRHRAVGCLWLFARRHRDRDRKLDQSLPFDGDLVLQDATTPGCGGLKLSIAMLSVACATPTHFLSTTDKGAGPLTWTSQRSHGNQLKHLLGWGGQQPYGK